VFEVSKPPNTKKQEKIFYKNTHVWSNGKIISQDDIPSNLGY